MTTQATVSVIVGEALGRYGFGDGHPLGVDRMHAFWDEMHRRDLEFQVQVRDPVAARHEDLARFHHPAYLERVLSASESGEGMLDYGDTPAYRGVYEDAGMVAGSTVEMVHRIMAGEVRRGFIPIAGLHHAMPETAAGFCVFNDIGIAIRVLQQVYGLERIAYVDIDAHHGDGVFYPFEDDPSLIFVDIHEDGRYIYPKTGFPHEVGRGAAKGTKLNIPLLPRANDDDFMLVWPGAEAFLRRWEPQFIILQCGADGLTGDPLAHLHYTAAVHARVTRDLCAIAEACSGGRMLALGGGGYDLRNVARAWTAVVDGLLESPRG